MFENLRWRITLMFVGLSAVVYISLTVLGLIIFEHGMTASIDKQLKVVLSEIGHAIEIENGKPKFRDWIRTVRTEPPRSIATMQLFDASGQLLEHYGASGVEKVFASSTEYHDARFSVRILCSPLTQEQKVLGYVQIQLSTRERDQTLRELRLNAIWIGLLFLLALTAISYWIAKRVTRPLQDSIVILRSFVADASHELNTPLTILQARMEALEHKLNKLGIEQEDSAIATKSLTRLNQVVNDLLLLTEVEDPVAGIKKGPVDISVLINVAADELQERFAQKQIRLIIEKSPKSFVRGNAQALQRLFSNLLENALRYTDENGSVTVSLTILDRSVRIIVQDTGIGIPAENLPRIFDRFYRVDQSRSRSSGGNGLGLAIAKAIVDAHHGSIVAESELAVGSKFIVTLPTVKEGKSSLG